MREKLPEYMIPWAIVKMEEMPLTGNGKINRSALPHPDRDDALVESSLTAPRNQIEEKLVKIWSELLGIEQLGVRDNFFDAGGHSLLAARLISRVRQEFEIELALRSIFEAPTIEKLAQIIQG